MGGKARPKTAKSGKSGKGKKGKKGKVEPVEEVKIEVPKEPEIQKLCLVCECIMVEPCKITDKWFCYHCIKQTKATAALKDGDEDDDDVPKPAPETTAPEDPNSPVKVSYTDIIKQAPKNPPIDIEL